jgi:hypothetical protein
MPFVTTTDGTELYYESDSVGTEWRRSCGGP